MKPELSGLTTDAPPVRRFAALALALVALGILLRLFLPLQNLADPELRGADGFVPLLTNDAGLYGFLARELLEGTRPADARHPVQLPSHLLAAIVRLTPLDLDQAVFWLPVLLAPLFVIPLVLIGRELRLGWTIFPTAAVALVIPAYYLRSHAGYCDTDMLNSFFPLLLALSMIRVVRHKRLREALPGILAILLYRGWYHAATTLIVAQLGFFFLYVLASDRKETVNYQALLCWGLMLAPGPWPLRTAAAALLLPVLPRLRIPYRLWWLVFAGGAAVLLTATDIGQSLLTRLHVYVFRPDALRLSNAGSGYSFVHVMDLVTESRPTDILKFTGTAAGHLLLFLPALAGLLLLIRRHREALLVLPILGLGLLALASGSRFTFYAAHVLPLGMAAFLSASHPLVKKHFRIGMAWFVACVVGIQGGNALFRMLRINVRNAVPVFSAPQLPVLRELGKHAGAHDYAVAWWDYGWPLWYHTGLATIIDNGRNQYDSHLVARLLTDRDQRRAARTARALVGLHAGAPHQPAVFSAVERYTNLAGFEAALTGSAALPKMPGRAFLILPRDMQTIIPGIMAHAVLDPQTGNSAPTPFWFFGRITERGQDRLAVAKLATSRRTEDGRHNRLTIDPARGIVTLEGSGQAVPLKRVITRGPDGSVGETRHLHAQGLNLVRDGEDITLCDDALFDSLYVRLFLFGDYDPALFRRVHADREIAVYEVIAE